MNNSILSNLKEKKKEHLEPLWKYFPIPQKKQLWPSKVDGQ